MLSRFNLFSFDTLPIHPVLPTSSETFSMHLYIFVTNFSKCGYTSDLNYKNTLLNVEVGTAVKESGSIHYF